MSEPTFSSSRSGESDSRLEAKHLAKSYGSRKVVKDVSLSVQKARSSVCSALMERARPHRST